MASPNSTFTEIVSTTLRNHPREFSDNVSKHNALWRRLNDRGKIKLLSGGYEIVRPLDYAENQTYQRYSGGDTLDIRASDVLSAAKYDWVQAAVHVVATGRELRQNSGKEALINLVESRMTNARRTAANNMSVDLYSNGSLANQMGGLAHIITSDGTGVVGGINSSTFTFWKNQFREFDGTPSSTTMKQEMQKLWLPLNRGTDRPDMIVLSHDYYQFYWDGLTDLQRYASSDTAVMGFNSLKFVDADVIFDSNVNFATDAQVGYFLNTDFLEICAHRDANWSDLGKKVSLNQDAEVMPVIWMGQLCCSNRNLQGRLINES